MPTLSQGSQGADVVALQQKLISLGFLPGVADGDFGSQTAQAVRDAQRRLLLLPDGVVGPLTQAALTAAVGRVPPSPTSVYRRLRRRGSDLAARGEASDAKLPILDRGIENSPFRSEPPLYAGRLATTYPASQLAPYSASPTTTAPYPDHGVVPPILSGRDGRGGLEFLSGEVAQGCVCVGSFAADQPLRVRWYGRRALSDNVQFWSASKFIAPLHVVCQANRRSPGVPVSAARLRSADGSASVSFGEVFTAMVTYGKGVPYSNKAAYQFKQLRNAGEPDVQSWTRSLCGNGNLALLGGYGAGDLFPGARLVGPGGAELVGARVPPVTPNRVSAYDLVRMITMLGWHHQLTAAGRLPGALWGSLATLAEGLGKDTARYLDVALEELGLLGSVAEPVILSKLGYGTIGDGAVDALTYVAFASFRDTRHSPARQRSFALALRIPTRAGNGVRDDARMGTEVTEIVRRVFAEELT